MAAKYSVEKIREKYSVVKASKFLFWTRKRFLYLPCFFSGEVFMWFGTHLSLRDHWTYEYHTFDTEEAAIRAAKVCEQMDA